MNSTWGGVVHRKNTPADSWPANIIDLNEYRAHRAKNYSKPSAVRLILSLTPMVVSRYAKSILINITRLTCCVRQRAPSTKFHPLPSPKISDTSNLYSAVNAHR